MSANAFYKLAPFIQDYIYKHNWTELRDIQVKACEVIFNTKDNLLLSSGTASGKTEAAFLPILTELHKKPSSSVGILYISPLKALINDQFYRLDGLLSGIDISVHKWHGDVNQSAKNRLYNNPQGVLQITPESLENMLMNRKHDIVTLFGDLRYIVIDEVHNFMSNERGIQLLCILERIQQITGNVPRRIGLSATLGDYFMVEEWLCSGTKRSCVTPIVSGANRNIRLAVEIFTVASTTETDEKIIEEKLAPFNNFIYRNTLNRRCIVFANSRSVVEIIIATLRRTAKANGTDDIYYVHHGNISASLREATEKAMKRTDIPVVTGATLTLELGIDIESLERIIQIDTPYTVSSFLQRLGRSGRRGTPSEMMFACIENEHSPDDDMEFMSTWSFLRGLSIIQLYLEERWIEPLVVSKHPFGLLYHQTMSVVASFGEVSPQFLAQTLLSLLPFKNISKESYKELLKHLLSINHLQLSDRGNLMIGIESERMINSYKFLAVFMTDFEYIVKKDSEELGSVNVEYQIGEKFALYGRSWEVINLDKKRSIIYVKSTNKKADTLWKPRNTSVLNTKVMRKMKSILESDDMYKFLGPKAKNRIVEIRQLALNMRVTESTVVPLGGNNYGIFTWLGTRETITLIYCLSKKEIEIDKRSIIPYYIVLNTDKPISTIIQVLKEIKYDKFDKYSLADISACIDGKFNDFIPLTLLNMQYVEDYIDIEGMQENLIIME